MTNAFGREDRQRSMVWRTSASAMWLKTPDRPGSRPVRSSGSWSSRPHPPPGPRPGSGRRPSPPAARRGPVADRSPAAAPAHAAARRCPVKPPMTARPSPARMLTIGTGPARTGSTRRTPSVGPPPAAVAADPPGHRRWRARRPSQWCPSRSEPLPMHAPSGVLRVRPAVPRRLAGAHASPFDPRRPRRRRTGRTQDLHGCSVPSTAADALL